MSYSLLVVRDTRNNRTGLREVDVCIVEKDEQGNQLGKGPLQTRGVELEVLAKLYGESTADSAQKYLVEVVKPEMITFYETWKTSGSQQLTGREL